MKTNLLLMFSIFQIHGFATSWLVGPTKQYKKPSEVVGLVNHGDTVLIDAGIYSGEVCVWTKNNLVIKGVGGRPHFKANGKNAAGKGIWVLGGNNTTVENIEFSEAKVPDENGAGIRLDGLGVTVKNCYFHDNENGILTANSGGVIRIEKSEFAYNGFGDGQSHNIYIGKVDSLIVRFSYFHHANVGHEIKSRARVNYVLYNRITNEATGNASREIDLPDGGIAVIMGNSIHQGPRGQNGNLIGYGLESMSNRPPHEVYLINNTLVNERTAGGSFFNTNSALPSLKVYNNVFAGVGTVIASGGSNKLDSASNRVSVSINGLGFVDPSKYDYKLNASSGLINKGSNLGKTTSNFSLVPVFEYVHPVNANTRISQGTIDIGGFEFVNATPIKTILGVDPSSNTKAIFKDNQLFIRDIPDSFFGGQTKVLVYDVKGKIVFYKEDILDQNSSFQVFHTISKGRIFVKLEQGKQNLIIPAFFGL
ncbi:MAG: right-handed parallel beta-helix repeat-containing protein [Leadbetterella sp.]